LSNTIHPAAPLTRWIPVIPLAAARVPPGAAYGADLPRQGGAMFTENARKPLIYIEILPPAPKNDILAVFTKKPNEAQQRRGLPVYAYGAYFGNSSG